MMKSEMIYRMKNTPRSYDMSRTHIMHKSVNHHVDVVLRSAPKRWKKKPVSVRVIGSEEQKERVKIRLNAKKGYVAVKRRAKEKYDAERKLVANVKTDDVVKYETVRLKNRGLIHDMKSQIALMSKRSAEYIDAQLALSAKKKADAPRISETNFAVTPEKPKNKMNEASFQSLEQQIEAQLDRLSQGGSSTSNSFDAGRPYADNYSRHVSEAEFRSLMTSLEKSLDEAFRRTGVSEESLYSKPSFTTTAYTGYSQNTPLSVDAQPIKPPAYEPKETKSDDIFTPVTSFDAANSAEQPIKSSFSVADDSFLPTPPAAEPPVDYTPVRLTPEYGQPEKEEYRPIMSMPEEDEEEEYRPIMMMPEEDEEEEYRPILLMPEEDDNESPSEAIPLPNSYEFPSNEQESVDLSVDDERHSQTFMSVTGNKIKKAIGIIRGKNSQEEQDIPVENQDIEIYYSDGE